MEVRELWMRQVRRIRGLYRQWFAAMARQHDLTQLQIDILLFLYINPDRNTAQNICDFRGLAKSNVSRGINELTERGLIVRSRENLNRREVRLMLTEAGKAPARSAKAMQEAFFDSLTADFTPQDHEHLSQLLNKLASNIARMVPEGSTAY